MPLLILACLMVSGHVLANSARLALVIGNADYGVQVPDPANNGQKFTPFADLARGPLLDAKGVGDRLKSLGFTLVNPDGDGAPVLDADVAVLRTAINHFTYRLGENPGALAFVFYAGHGVAARATKDSPLATYLIPARSNLLYEHQAPGMAVSLEEITAGIAAANAAFGAVVLDACRTTDLRSVGGKRSADTRGLALPKVDKTLLDGTLMVAFSTREGSVADNKPGTMSPYSKALAAHLGTPGLRLHEVFTEVYDDMVAMGTGQRPDVRLFGPMNPVLVPAALQAGPQLSITSVPSGADVFIDEVKLGTTPLTDGTLEAGQTVTIRVVLPGHVPVTQRVRMGNGSMPVHVALSKGDLPDGNSSVAVQNSYQPPTFVLGKGKEEGIEGRVDSPATTARESTTKLWPSSGIKRP